MSSVLTVDVSPSAPPAWPAFDVDALFGMSPQLDELSLQFAVFARHAKRPVLDIGTGDGIAVEAAIARGAHVHAVDPAESALKRLRARVPLPRHPRLKTQVSQLPDLEFKFARFSAVHVSRVLHLVDREEMQVSLRKFYRWVYPGGKLFLSAFTPAGFQSLEPGRFLLLEEADLKREVQLAGFLIESSFTYALPWNREQVCCAVIAECQP